MNKMPIRRDTAARQLAAAFRVHGPLVARELEPLMAKVLEEGEAMPDVAHLLDVLGRVVVAESLNLRQASRKKGRESSQASWLRRQLREAEPELREKVTEVRGLMVKFFGAKETTRLLGYRGRTPRGREELGDLAFNMVHLLPVLKVRKVANQEIDAGGWARYMQPALSKFSGLMEQLEGRLDNQAVDAEIKKETMGAFDRTYRRILRLGKIFYQLAGLERLAEKLSYRGGRPASQKKGTPRVA